MTKRSKLYFARKGADFTWKVPTGVNVKGLKKAMKFIPANFKVVFGLNKDFRICASLNLTIPADFDISKFKIYD